MNSYFVVFVAVLYATITSCRVSSSGLRSSTPFLGAQTINVLKISEADSFKLHDYGSQEAFSVKEGYDEFPELYFTQPLDHFSADIHNTFKQRYWFSKRHYKKGGPVFILDSGEVIGEERLPFLDTGILEILSKATNGIGVILEHRYYGKSIPVANFSTDSLRWLTNDQAVADTVNFMSKVKLEGIQEDITAPQTPWIYYGGSYAGGRSAHMRVLHPDLVYGALSSSGVIHATIELPEYMEVIRNAAPVDCSKGIESSIAVIDHILLHNTLLRKPLKALFGLADLEHDDDFVSLIASPLGKWQDKNWDPDFEFSNSFFDEFCDILTSRSLQNKNDSEDEILIEGWRVPSVLVNYAKYIRKNYVSKCPSGNTIENCFGTRNATKYQGTDLSETWRAWTFQVCTTWGYFIIAPNDPKQPRIISSLKTLESTSRICRQAFPPGQHFAVPNWPNVTAVNTVGDFAITADRLALINGEVDPWRPVTAHSQYAENRSDTITRPFKLIRGGVHRYDENGLRNTEDEPPNIRKIHKEEIEFVKEWLKERRAPH